MITETLSRVCQNGNPAYGWWDSTVGFKQPGFAPCFLESPVVLGAEPAENHLLKPAFRHVTIALHGGATACGATRTAPGPTRARSPVVGILGRVLPVDGCRSRAITDEN